MKFFKDYQGTEIRLTDERQAHILEHPEMAGMEEAINETLLKPECVVQSNNDEDSHLYYRYYAQTLVGGKFLCVVVKVQMLDAFVLTAYLTDKIKKGKVIWNEKA